jgi:hypothetical protein
MITSDKQLKAAKEKIQILEDGLKIKPEGVPAALIKAREGQAQEFISSIKNEIEEYESLKKAKKKTIQIKTVEDLFTAPIKYRIAHNMTIEQFANYVSIHSRQIARYEKELYQNIAASLFLRILKRLDVDISGTINGDYTLAVKSRDNTPKKIFSKHQ